MASVTTILRILGKLPKLKKSFYCTVNGQSVELIDKPKFDVGVSAAEIKFEYLDPQTKQKHKVEAYNSYKDDSEDMVKFDGADVDADNVDTDIDTHGLKIEAEALISFLSAGQPTRIVLKMKAKLL